MFDEKFERLSPSEQEQFKVIVNFLLASTFLNQAAYDFDENVRRTNRNYLFVERNFELFAEYLSYAGFALNRDSSYGVIYLTSEFDSTRQRFGKLTTMILFTLRLIYEEEREKLSLAREIFTTTSDVVHKMISLGIMTKKPADKQLSDSFRLLARFQVIDKTAGTWQDPQTRILILPTILFMVTNEKISAILSGMEQEAQEPENEEDDDAEFTEASADQLV